MQELISIDGWPVFGQDIPAVSQRVKGKVGTSVTLEVFSSYETCHIPVPRSLHRKITWQRAFLRSLV
jgi:C-terminal processing protease CtpA/Prc